MRTLLSGMLLLGSAAAAHETYFVPVGPLAPNQPVTLRLTSGMAFPKPETGPKAARVAKAAAHIGTAAQPFGIAGESAEALLFKLTPETAGLLVVSVDLAPHPITLSADKVAEYFAEVDPAPTIRHAYAAQPAPRQWREMYTKHAKALFCVAPCPDSGAARTLRGQSLEFVAADAGLRRFTLLEKGRPRVDQPVVLITDGREVKLRTDREGQVTLPATASGPLLLSTTIIRMPAAGSATFTSDFATLLFTAPAN